MSDLASMDGSALIAAYRSRCVSPREVLQDALRRAEKADPTVNAFALVAAEGALEAARQSEERWMRNRPCGPLDGLPCTIKDAINWAGHPNRGGFKLSPAAPVPENAPTVEDLLEAGAIPIGKTTLPEFGWKAVGDSPLYGVTRNPWDTRMATGGSSAGAGAAAAFNLGVMHLGMDSAGSIRIPASFCGVFGLKPSHGRAPSSPPVPFALISDIGPLTRTVRDAALMLTVIAGPDLRDIWSIQTHNTPPDGRFGNEWFKWAPYSYPFDLTLEPAASVPCGRTGAGLPVGLQIVGRLLRDDLVLRASRAFEAVRPWPMPEEPV
jgi:aspartyl-tRNA(Asn)/glutamyl-tRNA(Gln) amidotransferase subunit A